MWISSPALPLSDCLAAGTGRAGSCLAHLRGGRRGQTERVYGAKTTLTHKPAINPGILERTSDTHSPPVELGEEERAHVKHARDE